MANGGYTFALREVADELRGLHGHGSTQTTTTSSATTSAVAGSAGGTGAGGTGAGGTGTGAGAGGGTASSTAPGSASGTDANSNVGVDKTTATRTKDAARLYTMAAEGGDIRSLMSLGWMMLDEEGIITIFPVPACLQPLCQLALNPCVSLLSTHPLDT